MILNDRYGFIILFVFITMTISSCEPQNQSNPCDPFGHCDMIGGPNYYYEPNQTDYIYPVFNPINNNEIISIRAFRGNDTTGGQLSLVKVNCITQTYQTILSNQFLTDNNLAICGLDWSSNGWIVIHDCNTNQLFKVQDDGNSFQQITFGTAGFSAGFSPDGNSIYFSDYTNGFMMNSVTGNIIDTIAGSFYSPGFLADGRIVCGNEDNIVRIIDTSDLVVTSSFPTNPVTAGFLFFDNIGTDLNEVIFNSNYYGIFRLNLTTHDIAIIKGACTNRITSKISVSPDGTKIIYQLDSFDAPNDACQIRSKSELHLMNIDGTNDEVLNLP